MVKAKLPKNITQRKDGRYCYRYQVDGKTKSIYSWNIDDLLVLKDSNFKADPKLAYSNEIIEKKLKNNVCKQESDISIVLPSEQFVYFVSDGKFVKIGVSQDVKKRIKQMQTGNSQRLTLVKCLKTHAPYLIENALHSMLETRRVNGEWYDILDLIEESEE